MKPNGMARALAKIIVVACTATSASACASIKPAVNSPTNKPASEPASKPGNLPAPPLKPSSTSPAEMSPNAAKGAGTWTFSYAPGTYTYNFTTTGTVAPATDTSRTQSVPTLNQNATIAVSPTGDVQVLDPVTAQSSACDPNTALITLAQQLIPRIPNQLVAGSTWRDSTTTSGCRGLISITSNVVSNYTVVGKTTTNNATVLQINRTDSLSANGEGADGQHRVSATAAGVGIGTIYLDPITGRLAGLKEVQNALISVTTSGRLTQFVQRATEIVSIVK